MIKKAIFVLKSIEERVFFMEKKPTLIHKVFNFYLEGFQGMGRMSKQLWLIILLKLFIMFAILRLFFFPNLLKNDFKNDKDRSEHVIEQLTKP